MKNRRNILVLGASGMLGNAILRFFSNTKGYKVKGPFPADTLFIKNNLKNFDVIIGMYHDQVITPLKTLYNFNAINITLGLPFIRISPDHGTNNQMLGKKNLIQRV